jgi:hypothetical protein
MKATLFQSSRMLVIQTLSKKRHDAGSQKNASSIEIYGRHASQVADKVP